MMQTTLPRPKKFLGTDIADSFTGGSLNDILFGGAGNDTLSGGGGDDRLFGGIGNDQLFGGDGADRLDGEAGDDVLRGEAGNDTMLGGDGHDFLWGGDGVDLTFGGNGNDTIRSGTGDDRLQGNAGNDMLCGAWGNDMLLGEEGNDILWGGDDNDHLQGGNGNDLVIGGPGSDYMAGCYGADFLLSRSDAGEPGAAGARIGNDILNGGPSNDVFRFELLLNARTEVIARNLNAEGSIDWAAAAQENGAVHDHWVEGIGHDTIIGCNGAEGDVIEIFGRGIEASITRADLNADGKAESIISLRAVAGNAANAGDLLGTITVFGKPVTLAGINLRADVDIGAFSRPEFGPLPDERIGLMPVGFVAPADWMA